MSYGQVVGYRHEQTSSSDTWVIAHGQGVSAPVVDVWIDVSGTITKIIPLSVHVDSINQVTITFSTPQIGEAVIL